MFTILKSKLRPPGVRRDAIDRAPLLLRLDTAAGSATTTAKVILVQAAPGYGKSTLLALWAAHLSAQAPRSSGTIFRPATAPARLPRLS